MVYTTLILTIFVVWVYAYSKRVFAFARVGRRYLKKLLDNPERLNTPILTDIIKNRDLLLVEQLLAEKGRLYAILIATFLVNVIVFIFYPYDALLYHWMGYILTAALIIQNIQTFRVFIHLHVKKGVISNMCDAYYKLEQEQKQLKNTIEMIELTFGELVKQINPMLDTEENIDDNDEAQR